MTIYFAASSTRAGCPTGTFGLRLSEETLATALEIAPGAIDPQVLSLDPSLTLRRRGVELKLVSGPPPMRPTGG